jgi:Autographiviridae endonuclease VII
MSVDQYKSMLARQNGACAICKRKSNRALCVDHCHVTGKRRGLLCDKCNMGLGLYDESPEFMQAAIAYLAQWRDA